MDKRTDNMIIQTLSDLLPLTVVRYICSIYQYLKPQGDYLEIGKTLSLNYFIFIGGGLIVALFLTEMSFPKQLSGVGDFLAGFFSPLAFLWLVIGYFMQNKELAMNREELLISRIALEKQAEELSNSVQEQKELVKLTKIEIENIINSQLPILNIESSYYYPKGSNIPTLNGSYRAESNKVKLYISNHGRDAKNSYIEVVVNGEKIASEIHQLDKSKKIEFYIDSNNIPKPPFIVNLYFTTESLEQYIQKICFNGEISPKNEITPDQLAKPINRLNDGN